MPVMISYSRTDWERVQPVVTYLKQSGIETWVDQENLKPFSNWRLELLRMPKVADAFVPFLSESYLASEMCRMELFLARSFERPIFPVMLEECWTALDQWEETTHLGRIFIARLGSQRLVGKRFERDHILERLRRAIDMKLNAREPASRNVFISFPGDSAEFATDLHGRISSAICKPWVATLDCEVGSDWRHSQVQAMGAANAHVVVVSDDYLAPQQALRTEILTSEALELPTFCICTPQLSADADLIGKVYGHLQNGEQALRRLTVHQWCKSGEIESHLAPALEALLGRG